jgi:hypothetical protein
MVREGRGRGAPRTVGAERGGAGQGGSLTYARGVDAAGGRQRVKSVLGHKLAVGGAQGAGEVASAGEALLGPHGDSLPVASRLARVGHVDDGTAAVGAELGLLPRQGHVDGVALDDGHGWPLLG